LPRVTLESAPETRFGYSNVGYAILGAALEQAAGMPYTDYVARNIFVPLGMTDTAFEPDAQMRTHLAKGYIVVKPGAVDESLAAAELRNGRGYKVPNGAIFTTVGDLAKFVSFEMGFGPGDVLSSEALRANFSRAFPVGNGSSEYGIGFMKEESGASVLVGHSGSVAGYTASAFFNPEAHVGVICLRNSSISCDKTVMAAISALSGH
jgi:CubicO group peptidase (beta-lactamase class C family)